MLRLLTPLARLALERGLAFGEAAELLKRAYVEAARRHFDVPGRKLTISRIAVLTGLTRKEASRLASKSSGDAETSDRGRVNRAARVLAAWAREPDYLDGRGAPASLRFEADGEAPSVVELVRRHGADVPPRAVLDELIRVGAVRELKDGRFKPIERAYVPQTDDAEKLTILGTDVADLISSIDHNLTELDEQPYFQRKVAYDSLPPEYLPALREIVRHEAQSLLGQLDREMARHDLDLNPDPKRKAGDPVSRAMVGIYYYEDEHHEDDE